MIPGAATLPVFLMFLGLGYVLGLFNPAHYLVRRRQGRDIREHGSGNAGATNAGRLLGRWGFAAVFLLDAAKGAAAVVLAQWLAEDPSVRVVALAGAVIGHIWPVQLGFRGGKGVSTLLGGVLAIDPVAFVILVAVFLPLYAIFRRFVPSGLMALATLPAILHFRHAGPFQVGCVLALAGLVWFAHRRQLGAEFRQAWARLRPGMDPTSPPP